MDKKANLPFAKRNLEIVRMVDERRMTMTAVAVIFNISKQRVQQIYSREKLRHV
tara:strand:+ start:482 stop:643 length:162 start_codon:yes stop_codon:yes gene_type:complete